MRVPYCRYCKNISLFLSSVTGLISNAIDAVAGVSGALRLRTKLVHAAGKQGIQVSIADNGQGIPAQVPARIFEPFYSPKGSLGTGLGLWVSREIVSKPKGSIRVRSKTNVGTVFTIFLPLDGVSTSVTAGKGSRELNRASG